MPTEPLPRNLRALNGEQPKSEKAKPEKAKSEKVEPEKTKTEKAKPDKAKSKKEGAAAEEPEKPDYVEKDERGDDAWRKKPDDVSLLIFAGISSYRDRARLKLTEHTCIL